MPVNPRRLVVRALARLERTPGGAGQAILRHALDGPDARDLDPRDRSLVTTCFYGVLRWRLRLDFEIARRARKGLPKDPEVANILRLGAFQLLFLDRVPARAAVHTSVNLARKMRGQAVGKFVNGVLRAIDRERGEPEELATRYGHPQWMVDRLQARLGDRLETRLQAHMIPPPVHLRVHPSARDQLEGLAPTPHPDVFMTDDTDVGSGRVRAGIRAGHWLPQDRASVEVADLLDIPDDHAVDILELCCGRGVKTTRLLERRAAASANGVYIAMDASVPRLHEAIRLCARWVPGHDAQFVAANAAEPLPLAGEISFDRILIDAPCSGLGVIRRRPEILWRRTPEDIQTLAMLQSRILRRALERLRPTGHLVYAVCTLTDEETDGVVDQVLAGQTGLVVTERRRFTPEDDGCDGFYAAVVQKSE